MIDFTNCRVIQGLKRIAPKIHMEQIEDFIDHVPGITNLQKLFYKSYVRARHELIICQVTDGRFNR